MNRDPVRCAVKMQIRFRGVCFICLRDCDELQQKECIEYMAKLKNQSSEQKVNINE